MKKSCSNSGSDMVFVRQEDMQLGRTSFLLGDWPNLLAGALNVEIWECPDCGKLDFYRAGDPEEDEGGIAQTVCPVCGAEHDLDDPKCPHCGAKNTAI